MRRRSLACLAIALSGCASPLMRAPPAAPAAMVAPEASPEPDGTVDPQIAVSAPAPPPASESDDEDEPSSAAPPPLRPRATGSLVKLDEAELERRYKADPASLGSISAGPPRAGLLLNGVQMPTGPGWVLLDPGRTWGTKETVEALALCIERVRQRFPGSPVLPIGHISAKGGGHLSPHLSHQSGRDVDLGYYTRAGHRGFATVTADTIDLPRTWALLKTALTETPIDMIFIDTSIQKMLADFALANGESLAFVDEVFQVRGKSASAPIRHIRGHANHIHIRFNAPMAEELGVRLARWLPKPAPLPPVPPRVAVAPAVAVVAPARPGATGQPAPPPAVAPHIGATTVGAVPMIAPIRPGPAAPAFEHIRARSGDTLVVWAKRYNTTVEEIQRANGLASIALKIGVVYRIPVKQQHPVTPVKQAISGGTGHTGGTKQPRIGGAT